MDFDMENSFYLPEPDSSTFRNVNTGDNSHSDSDDNHGGDNNDNNDYQEHEDDNADGLMDFDDNLLTQPEQQHRPSPPFPLSSSSSSSTSSAMSLTPTEPISFRYILRSAAQYRLNMARKALIPSVVHRNRYAAFLDRVNCVTGDLQPHQPPGEIRRILTPTEIERLRQQRKAVRRWRDVKDPIVALRRYWAVMLWIRGGGEGLRGTLDGERWEKEWEEARPGMEMWNEKLGLGGVLAPFEAKKGKEERKGEKGKKEGREALGGEDADPAVEDTDDELGEEGRGGYRGRGKGEEGRKEVEAAAGAMMVPGRRSTRLSTSFSFPPSSSTSSSQPPASQKDHKAMTGRERMGRALIDDEADGDDGEDADDERFDIRALGRRGG